jgi:hypothetical protein
MAENQAMHCAYAQSLTQKYGVVEGLTKSEVSPSPPGWEKRARVVTA